MVTRQERIDDFIHEGSPPNDQPLQILCEDHVGTYVISIPVPVAQWLMGKRKNKQTHRSYGGRLAGSKQNSALNSEIFG